MRHAWSVTSPLPPGVEYQTGAPLGGSEPPPPAPPPRPSRRPLVLAGILLVAAVLCGAASLMTWRDYGNVVTAGNSTGWNLPDGSIGRGWLAIALGITFAVAGVLVAAERERPGRITAVIGGVTAMVLAVVEWGVTDGPSRTGPGLGLWLLFLIGFGVVLAVGIIAPETSPVDVKRGDRLSG